MKLHMRRRCAVCKKWMEKGDTFIFEKFRFNGRDITLPIHPEHKKEAVEAKAKLTDIRQQALVNGPKGLDIVSDAVVDELKAEIERGKQWGLNAIPHARVESLLRKYEIQTPGKIDDQPGEWQIRGGNVDAIQHDGTYEQAQHIRDWAAQRGGTTKVLSEATGDDLGHFYLKVDSPRTPDLLGPSWWLVRTADGIFFAVSDVDFHIIYIPREK